MRNGGMVRYYAAYGGIAVVAMWVAVRRAGGICVRRGCQ